MFTYKKKHYFVILHIFQTLFTVKVEKKLHYYIERILHFPDCFGENLTENRQEVCLIRTNFQLLSNLKKKCINNINNL